LRGTLCNKEEKVGVHQPFQRSKIQGENGKISLIREGRILTPKRKKKKKKKMRITKKKNKKKKIKGEKKKKL